MIKAQQVGAVPIRGQQAPTVGLQAGSLPATTGATQLTDIMNTMMPMMMFMIMMVMMMSQMTKVTEKM